ncbi:MAG TPA: hypothetical protein PLB90_09395 [Opitutaceae bacterium]|nr:hypothetical protein [Opitutaceae bacterium]
MKVLRILGASLAALLVTALLHGADGLPKRVISVQEINTDDPSGYAMFVAKTNEVAKAKLGVDSYIRVYSTNYDGQKTNSVRAVIAADSVAQLAQYSAQLKDNVDLLNNREHLMHIRTLGASVLYQGLRIDGTYKGAWVYVTLATIADEAAYLKSLDGLREVFDANGLKDAKINCYRVMAGRLDHSHRITITFDSEARLAVFLDTVNSSAQMQAWLASVASNRKVVSNFTGHEITK